ncbi:MAG: hypothetical protein ACHQAY_27150 [Hyphomicrobiales bacterium]
MSVTVTVKPKPAPETLVSARRKTVEARIAELRSEMQALEAELPELITAERVLLRLAGIEVPSPPSAGPDVQEDEQFTKGKPENTPPMTEMIFEALNDAAKRGAPGLEPSGIASYIRGKWWSNAPSTAIGPIAWRMWKRNQIGKRGDLYPLKNSGQGG